MTKSGVGYLSALRRTFVGHISVAVLLGTGAAHAGPNIWQTFETRCIAPIEEIEEIDISGLSAKPDIENAQVFHDADGLFTLLRDKIGAGKSNFCRITDFYDLQAGDAFERWAGMALSDGRYEMKQNSGPAILLQSTFWREPRVEIEVDFLGLTGQRFFEIRETDLES